MSRSFYTETWTRLRAVLATDAHGNKSPDWSDPDEATISGCRLQPVSAEELMENRFESDVRYRLLAPFGSDVTYMDRLVGPDSLTYEVAADPLKHQSPLGAARHDEIMLRRVTG